RSRRAARGDVALRRSLTRDDDRKRCPERAAGLAGPGAKRPRRADRRAAGRATAGDRRGRRDRDRAVRGNRTQLPGNGPDPPLRGPAPAQPPANIAILPFATFAAKVAPALPTVSQAAGASAVPGSQAGTQWQVQVQLGAAALNGSPAHALQQATRLRNRVERS